jgi:hypothetical protein
MFVSDELERMWKPVLRKNLILRFSVGLLGVTTIDSIIVADLQHLKDSSQWNLFSCLKRAEYFCQMEVIFQLSEKIN